MFRLDRRSSASHLLKPYKILLFKEKLSKILFSIFSIYLIKYLITRNCRYFSSIKPWNFSRKRGIQLYASKLIRIQFWKICHILTENIKTLPYTFILTGFKKGYWKERIKQSTGIFYNGIVYCYIQSESVLNNTTLKICKLQTRCFQ